jgi:hypothetical protein
MPTYAKTTEIRGSLKNHGEDGLQWIARDDAPPAVLADLLPYPADHMARGTFLITVEFTPDE